MNNNELYQRIHNFCVQNANENVALNSQRYFKETYDGYGLTTAQINAEVNEILKNKNLTLDAVLQTLSEKLISGRYEEISFGLLLMNGLKKQFTKDAFNGISELFSQGIYNWAHADTLGMFILPDFLLKNIVELSDFDTWLASGFKFQRRCVPVTFIKVIKKERQVQKYIDKVLPLMTDNEREVHQGVGWFLREAWKIQPEIVEPLLLQWKDSAPRLIMQYACEKMTPEQKQLYKKSKKK